MVSVRSIVPGEGGALIGSLELGTFCAGETLPWPLRPSRMRGWPWAAELAEMMKLLRAGRGFFVSVRPWLRRGLLDRPLSALFIFLFSIDDQTCPSRFGSLIPAVSATTTRFGRWPR